MRIGSIHSASSEFFKKNQIDSIYLCAYLCIYVFHRHTWSSEDELALFLLSCRPGSIYLLNHLASPGDFITLALSLPPPFSVSVCLCWVVYTHVCVSDVLLCQCGGQRKRSGVLLYKTPSPFLEKMSLIKSKSGPPACKFQ